jgi:hypothetical protein
VVASVPVRSTVQVPNPTGNLGRHRRSGGRGVQRPRGVGGVVGEGGECQNGGEEKGLQQARHRVVLRGSTRPATYCQVEQWRDSTSPGGLLADDHERPDRGAGRVKVNCIFFPVVDGMAVTPEGRDAVEAVGEMTSICRVPLVTVTACR